MRHQLAAELPQIGGRAGLMLSASREIEPDTRAAILLADGLFRLDVTVLADTLRTTVRNLSTGELTMQGERAAHAAPTNSIGDVDVLRPTGSSVAFALGAGEDRVEVRIAIGTLRFAQLGTYRVTAQAIVRQAPATPGSGSQAT